MAVPSNMLALGTPLPHFELPDSVSGGLVNSRLLEGSVAVVAFICNHCPYVVHIKDALSKFATDYQGLIKMVAVSSNSVESHPMDGPEHMAEDARRHGYGFPYLFDETQAVARACPAARTTRDIRCL